MEIVEKLNGFDKGVDPALFTEGAGGGGLLREDFRQRRRGLRGEYFSRVKEGPRTECRSEKTTGGGEGAFEGVEEVAPEL